MRRHLGWDQETGIGSIEGYWMVKLIGLGTEAGNKKLAFLVLCGIFIHTNLKTPT